jgi:hypothetical protein
VPPHGGSDWVRNLRAAGKGELSRKGRTEAFHPVGVPVDQRGPVIAGIAKPPVASRAPVFAKLPDARDHPGVPNRQQSRQVIPITGAEARNPAFLPAARAPGVQIPGRRGQRAHGVVVIVPLSVPFARPDPRRWWPRTDACRRVGIAAPSGDLR